MRAPRIDASLVGCKWTSYALSFQRGFPRTQPQGPGGRAWLSSAAVRPTRSLGAGRPLTATRARPEVAEDERKTGKESRCKEPYRVRGCGFVCEHQRHRAHDGLLPTEGTRIRLSRGMRS